MLNLQKLPVASTFPNGVKVSGILVAFYTCPCEYPNEITDEQLKGCISPLVEARKGEQVKNVISRFAPKLGMIPQNRRAEFIHSLMEII